MKCFSWSFLMKKKKNVSTGKSLFIQIERSLSYTCVCFLCAEYEIRSNYWRKKRNTLATSIIQTNYDEDIYYFFLEIISMYWAYGKFTVYKQKLYKCIIFFLFHEFDEFDFPWFYELFYFLLMRNKYIEFISISWTFIIESRIDNVSFNFFSLLLYYYYYSNIILLTFHL